MEGIVTVHKKDAIVLVIGGAGFIGSHTVDLLLQDGYRVRVLDNFSTGRRENLPASHPGLEILTGNLNNHRLLQEAFTNVNAVLHLAAQVSVQRSIEDPISSCEQNILGFLRVLEQARRSVVRVVYASSAAVYGDPQFLPLHEDGPTQPISPYGLEKYSNELYAQLFQKMYGLSVLGLRYFNVYGTRQDPSSPYSGVISRFIDQLRNGQPLTIRGDGLQERDFIHVSDVARANVAALKGRYSGVINVASGTKTTVRDLAELLIAGNEGKGEVQLVSKVEGDILQSRADITRMGQLLTGTTILLEQGLRDLLSES